MIESGRGEEKRRRMQEGEGKRRMKEGEEKRRMQEGEKRRRVQRRNSNLTKKGWSN